MYVKHNCEYKANLCFCPPVWKTDVLCRVDVRPSVCPSVRPSFPDFFPTCFEISIWNLVYTFSRWHDMSNLSFITIESLWPSFFILQIWYLDGPLYTSRHKFRFLQKSYFRNFGSYFYTFWILRSFPCFFVHVLRYQFETWYIHLVGNVTRQVRVSFQSGHFDLLYSLK